MENNKGLEKIAKYAKLIDILEEYEEDIHFDRKKGVFVYDVELPEEVKEYLKYMEKMNKVKLADYFN